MKTRTAAVFYALITMYLLGSRGAGSLLLPPCRASFFEMALKQDSLYTPGEMNLSVRLTDKAKIHGAYRVKVSIYIAGTLVRRQALRVTKKKPAVFELIFPEVHNRTEVRCRAELFLNGEFVEAMEKPLTLWPAISPYLREFTDKVIWAFDTSGKLQQLFGDLQVRVTDATFQAARDFGTPNIVFIGQFTDLPNMQVIIHRLMLVDTKPIIIFLRQERLLEDAKIEIPKENNHPQNVLCDVNAPLLNGLSKRDIMNMVDHTMYVKLKKVKGRSIDSCVTEVMEDKKSIYSYLCVVKEKGQVTIYCQLPVIDGNDPRFHILFKNLLKFATTISNCKKN
ncbi:MAG: hypothetical protein ACE5NM_12995 [Sedimentisphaerales bacterium]